MNKEVGSFAKWLTKQLEQKDVVVKEKASLDDTDAPADSTITRFGVGLPVGEALPMFVMFVAGIMWLFRLGTELAYGARLVRGLPSERSARFKREAARVQ